MLCLVNGLKKKIQEVFSPIYAVGRMDFSSTTSVHWVVALLSAVSLGKCNFSLNTGLSEDQAVTNHEGFFSKQAYATAYFTQLFLVHLCRRL